VVSRKRYVNGFSLVVALACAGGAAIDTAAQGRSITVGLVSPERQPVSGARVQLLITSWGVSDEYELPVRGHVLDLDFTALAARVGRVDSSTSAFIYIKAGGYTPLMSQPFPWPLIAAATIDFRGGRTIRTDAGVTPQAVQLRRALPRRIHFVDQQDRPYAGAKIEAAAYWNTPNHCGVMLGRDVLATGVTDASGSVDVPDVDGNHAIVIHEDRVMFADAVSEWPVRQVATVRRLTQADTTLRVHRFQPRRLSVDIIAAGHPVAGAVLWADMGFGACGAGYGPLGTADARGRVSQDVFYPEEWKAYWICAGGKRIWISPDSQLPATINVGVTPSFDVTGGADLCPK
jgi:hypothetical protein